MALDPDFTIKHGDTSPPLEAKLLRDGSPLTDLNNATVAFSMEHVSKEISILGLCTIEDKDDGLVAYIWNDGDTATPGTYEAEFYVDYDIPESIDALEKDETFPSDDYLIVEVNESNQH